MNKITNVLTQSIQKHVEDAYAVLQISTPMSVYTLFQLPPSVAAHETRFLMDLSDKGYKTAASAGDAFAYLLEILSDSDVADNVPYEDWNRLAIKVVRDLSLVTPTVQVTVRDFAPEVTHLIGETDKHFYCIGKNDNQQWETIMYHKSVCTYERA